MRLYSYFKKTIPTTPCLQAAWPPKFLAPIMLVSVHRCVIFLPISYGQVQLLKQVCMLVPICSCCTLVPIITPAM